MKYTAFISYKHSKNGRRHAAALEKALWSFARPTFTRPMKIFRDEMQMVPDGSLPNQIRKGLESSKYLIFLAEKVAAESEWCQKELLEWCDKEDLNRHENLIVVRIGGSIAENTKTIDWEKTNALPLMLKEYLTSIPLYVDLSKFRYQEELTLNNEEYKERITPLIARLRDIEPEDLKSVELRIFKENIARLQKGIGVLITFLLISIGASIWALDAQNKAEASALEAIKQQQIAEENAAEAKKQQYNAEKNAAEAKKQQQIAEKNLADRIEQERQKERLNFDKYVNDGDVFTKSSDYKIALRYYLKADSILLKFPRDPKLSLKKEILFQKIMQATNKIKMEQ